MGCQEFLWHLVIYKIRYATYTYTMDVLNHMQFNRINLHVCFTYSLLWSFLQWLASICIDFQDNSYVHMDMIGSRRLVIIGLIGIKLMFNLLCLILPNSINSFLHIDCAFWGNVFIRDWIIQTRRGHISKRKFREMNQHFVLFAGQCQCGRDTAANMGRGSVGMGAAHSLPRFWCVKQSLVCGWYERSSIYHMSMALFLHWYLLDTTYWPGHWAQEKL